MAMSWSTTKGVTSTVLHMLADRGRWSTTRRCASYWPEFAANGKGAVTVRQVMAMEAGLYDVRHLIDDPRELLDHDDDGRRTSLRRTASRARPGERVSRVHVRLDRRRVGAPGHRDDPRCVRAERDCVTAWASTAASSARRLPSSIGWPPVPALQPGAPARPDRRESDRSVTRPSGSARRAPLQRSCRVGGHKVIPTTEFLAAEVPAVNGVFTARSLARVYAALGSPDGLDGVRLWSTRPACATQTQIRRRDQIVPIRLEWRLGYHQPFPTKHTRRRPHSASTAPTDRAATPIPTAGSQSASSSTKPEGSP